MKLNFLTAIICISFLSCSTRVQIQDANEFKGKRVGVQLINISNLNLPKKQKTGTDTICACISQSTTDAIYPFLQQSGLTVIPLNLSSKANIFEVVHTADSLKLDYVFVGTGIVNFEGSSPFMHELTVKLIKVKTGEAKLSGSFTGAGVGPVKAMSRIGKKMVKHVK
ncbi:MAG: hypothetical protein NTZ19_07200 [Bacteroidetes bacterium]|nr:hypothetical protein [Bacteroidota bacterium]